ncbi:T9SS type B sorting domain-containing protein [Flavobacteriaceae bacterium]|nr:T9SS type B sorting domain-containing protein [Flavobacteriaceae bacterium]
MKKLHILLLTIVLLFVHEGFSQLSKTHYIPPVTGDGGGNGPGIQRIYISTPNPGIVNYSIRYGGEIGTTGTSGTLYQDGTVSNSATEEVNLSDQPLGGNLSYGQIFVEDSETELILNKGFVITADSEIYVSYRFVSQSYNQAGAIVSKGISALGTSFRAGMLQNYSSSHLGFISVMATENNTKIDFDLPGSVQTTGGQNDHSITLEKFQSYFFINRDTQNSLIGTLISSNKPIAVNTGGFGSFDSSSGGQDYGMDQIVGSTLIGSEYIFIKGIASDAIETVLIIADKDNTDLYLNDGSTVYKTLNTGEYVFIKGGDFIDGNLYVYSDDPNKKLFAYQGTGKTYTSPYEGANQGMYFVPALNCATKGDVDNIASINEIGARDFNDQAIVSFITKNGANILVNGSDVTGPPYNATPTTVVGNSDYVTYKVQDLTGNVKVEADDELYVAYVNTNAAATTAGFYSGFTVPPNVDLDADLKTLGSCLNKNGTSNVIFEASNFTQFDSIEWMKYDTSTGDFVAIPGETEQFFTPSVIGNYVLKGILACNNKEYLSPEIIVSICPDDSDSDGIIDNIDLDLDNDGILNSIESNGGVIFDLTNLNSSLVLPNSITNNGNNIPMTLRGDIFRFNSGATSNSISGETNGDFETKVPSNIVIGAETSSSRESSSRLSASYISYKLDQFSESLNLKFTAQPVTHSSVSGEYFEISVFPTSKNITLLDPKNNLIIKKPGEDNYTKVEDLNSLNQYSSNTIRFKFNPDVSSEPEFEFIGYNLEGIEFTHYADNNATASIFKGNITGVDYAINSDKDHPVNADSVADYLDTDSDGDECNDVTEAGFDDGILIDGVLGNIVPTFDDSQVDNRGRVIDPEHDYEVFPLKDPVTELYYFQQVGQAVEIISEPSSTVGCIGDTVSFNVSAQHSSNLITYQWQFFDSSIGTDGDWVNIDGTNTKLSGFDSAELIITDIDTSLTGDYRVRLNTEEYKCIVNSNLGANIGLTVNTPPAPPVVEPIQTFCLTDNPTVGDLAIAPAPANPEGLLISVYDDYDPSDVTVGVLLDNADSLVDGTTYFIQVTDSEGCVGVSRSETKVLLPNPVITPSVVETCPGDEITITVSGVPQTALDFELANPILTKVLADYTDNEGRLSSYFVDPTSRSFSQAEDLLPTYGIGASMYQINDLDEHDAVFAAIQSAGLAGVPLWLGLKQFPALNPNETFDEGWYWLDGRELDPAWNLWDSAEPNDYEFDADCNGTGPDGDNIDDGSEDYGHFNLGGDGNLLNDYPDCPGSPSRPVYEFRGRTTVRWYYEDPSDPGTFIDIPVNASTLTLSPQITTTYFIDVTTNGKVCSTSYSHVVNPIPVPNPAEDIYLCDEVDLDNTDSTSTDGISYSFDLESQTTTIVNEQVDRDNNPLSVTYHTTPEDAESGDNPITSPYTNVLDPDGNLYDPQTIYVRLLDVATGCYNSTETFNIIVNSTPDSFVVEVPEVCDDTDSGSDTDGSSKFDLTLLNDDILGADQVARGNFKVTYHLSQDEADDPLTYPDGIADPTAHYNTPEGTFDPANPTVQTEEIFVRVTDTSVTTLCFRADTSFILTVNTLPVILNPIWKVEQCDNPLFDLTDYNEKLSTYPESETFTYFKENGDEISLEDAKKYISISTSLSPEIIDVVMTKDVGECSRTTQIELKVSYSQVPADFAPTFIANNQNDLFKSETDTDLTGQIQNGKEAFSKSIFENIIAELKTQAPLAFDIPGINFEFYGSQRDATLRDNKIDISQLTYINQTETPDIATGDLTSNYNVIENRWEQEIWVYIENTNLSIIQSSCVGLEHVTTLYVEKRPVIYDINDQLLCDNETTLDMYSVFDTSTLQNLILGNTTDSTILPFQDPSNFTIEYTYIDNSGDTVTSVTLPTTINLTNQKVDIKLTNIVGLSKPFESIGSINFKVFQTPTPFSGIKIEECDDEESGENDDGKSVFDIDLNIIKNSFFIDPTDSSSTSVQDFNDFEFNFSLYDNNDTLISGPSDSLDPKITAENGYYIITEISNPLSTALSLSCESSTRIDFIVNPLPSFDIDDEIIVCLNPLPDNPLEIGTSNWNGGNDPSIYNYSWSRADLNGVDDIDYNENTETIKVDKGGVYTVIVEDPLTFCTRSKNITVTESEIAKITLDHITIEDLKNDNTNTITIDTLNLGIGNYEFSLDESFGPYQDNPLFESVKPGIHTIYIRDKNSYYTYDYGCGIAQVEVSVIGYRKYFTPNGDGINETWKILGIRSDFNAGSKVYIFDRFGKLLKELDPLSNGWDGTYLGKPMPATDYWFRTYLEDGREFKGHFSLVRGN